MSNKVNYEWVIEHEDEYGDIIDLDFQDKLSAYREDDFEPIDGCVKATLTLRRYEFDEYGRDTDYCYPSEDGSLVFTDCYQRELPNMKVPKKLQEEYSRFINRKAGIK